MSQHQLSKWWFLGPPFAIAVSLLAYYAMFPSVRGWVDVRFPWVANHIGIHLPARNGEEQMKRLHPVVVVKAPEPPLDTIPATPAPPPKPVYVTPDGLVDLPKLTANPTAWPKAVALRTPKSFPAVFEGKVKGSAIVPKGAEVRLLKIEGGKLGLEYRGGGAWVEVDETDLAERLRDTGG